jgi:hypothetical protein
MSEKKGGASFSLCVKEVKRKDDYTTYILAARQQHDLVATGGLTIQLQNRDQIVILHVLEDAALHDSGSGGGSSGSSGFLRDSGY